MTSHKSTVLFAVDPSLTCGVTKRVCGGILVTSQTEEVAYHARVVGLEKQIMHEALE